MPSIAHAFRVTVVALLACPLGNASAGDWFDTETRVCDFSSPVSFSLPFSRKSNSSGGQVFSVPKSSLNQLLTVPGGTVQQSNDLPSHEVAKFKAAIEALRSGPQAASVALSVAGEITDFAGVFGLAAGGLLGWLSSEVDAKAINIDRLLDFITVGGQAGYRVAFRSTAVGFNPLILVMTHYQVQVGAESKPRRWLLATCLLPLEVVLSEITTTAPGPNANNKRISRQPDGTWRQWDITDGKFDSSVYLYIEQDQAFAYFVDTGDSTKKTRIHLYGGPMQRNKGSGWNSLYLTTESK